VLDWTAATRAGSWAARSTPAPTVSIATRTSRRNKAALIWEGEPGDRRTLTYFDLYRQVSPVRQRPEVARRRKGDRVALYLPLIPELAIAMLACARIGAVHSVVFGGFSAESLRDRINDAQCRRLLVTADGGYRRGHVVRSSRWPTRRCRHASSSTSSSSAAAADIPVT
jgi:acyl-coenzyme A synthetase/AMP-(fatty) acid ligase